VKRDAIDFHAVEEKHQEIHQRLVNWALWCNGRESGAMAPMWRMSVSTARAKGAEHTWATVCIDRMDAQRIQKAVTHLPEGHRDALNWSYVKPINPKRQAAIMGTTLVGLSLLVRDGRQMLVNRKA
jgi:DNA-directed RNA polymerase specialized sigma24 family protein